MIATKLRKIGPQTGHCVGFASVIESDTQPTQSRAIAIAAHQDGCKCIINADGETLAILIDAVRDTFIGEFTVNNGDFDNSIELRKQ